MAKGDRHCFKCNLNFLVSEYGDVEAAKAAYYSHIATKEHRDKVGPMTAAAKAMRSSRAQVRKNRNARRKDAKEAKATLDMEEQTGPVRSRPARNEEEEPGDEERLEGPEGSESSENPESSERPENSGTAQEAGSSGIPFPGPPGEQISERLSDVEGKPVPKPQPATGARGGIVLDDQGMHYRISSLLLNNRVMMLFEWTRQKWPKKYGSGSFEASMSEFLNDSVESLFISEGIAPVIYRQALGLNGRTNGHAKTGQIGQTGKLER